MIAHNNETKDTSKKTSNDSALKASALTGIDDDLIVDAIDNKPVKRHFPWLAAAAALTALIAGGLIVSHFLNNGAKHQDAMVSANPVPTEQPTVTDSEAEGTPTEHPDPPTGNPVPSYSVWEDKLPSATQAPNLYPSIDALADAIRHGDQELIETIDRVYLPGNLPINASFRCIRPDRNPVVEYALIGSDPADGDAIVLLFQRSWSDFDIGSYLRADNRVYEEHDGLFIVTGYNEGDPRIGNMPAAGNLKNVYWTREEGLFLLRVPRSYTVGQIRALTELECILLPNADPDFKPYEHFAFDSLDAFVEALQTGDHSDDELLRKECRSGTYTLIRRSSNSITS